MGITAYSRKNSCAADVARTFGPRRIDRWGAREAAISVSRRYATSCPSETDLSDRMNSDSLRPASSKIVSMIDVFSQAASRTRTLPEIARLLRPHSWKSSESPAVCGLCLTNQSLI
jgi:hypothetical protein